MARNKSEIDAVLALLKDAGAVVDRIAGGKHHKVYWHKGDFKSVSIVPKTPTDHRSRLNTLGRVKRKLRSIDDPRLQQGRTGSNVPSMNQGASA